MFYTGLCPRALYCKLRVTRRAAPEAKGFLARFLEHALRDGWELLSRGRVGARANVSTAAGLVEWMRLDNAVARAEERRWLCDLQVFLEVKRLTRCGWCVFLFCDNDAFFLCEKYGEGYYRHGWNGRLDVIIQML